METNIEIINCIGCNHSEPIDAGHHLCKACQDDITRITDSKDISSEVKEHIINNYSKYYEWLMKQSTKFEWKAEYHSFQETCEEFYICNT